ncbi:DNA polymerase IV [candidate division KSB1 bacterium]|nr:DNA polymerase IV [candidate division KSB1 bacterium]
MSRIILHIDMDAFFAAIEQRDCPAYRGKPLVVGADPKGGRGRGVVSTCSYEARRYGIHSAMPISEAYRRCPDAIYVFPRGHRYADVSHQIMSLLDSYSPDIEQLSIDEAFLDITTSYKLHGTPEKLACDIKRRIRQEVELTASIGIAPNKFVAKVASDLRKPDGLVIVEEADVEAFLQPLDISRLWGVGVKTLPRLQQLGIHTIGDLARLTQDELYRRFGQTGLHFYRLAHGIDDRAVETSGKAKSISKEVTFDVDSDDEETIHNTLRYLCNELAREMRRQKYRGRTITLKIRLHDFTTFTRSRTLNTFVNHFDDIFANIGELYAHLQRDKVRLVGVAVSQLEKGEGQLDLFAPAPAAAKVDDVMDEIREKFGEKAITRASLIHHQHDSQWIREQPDKKSPGPST